MHTNLTIILDLTGTFVFAISGIRLASGKQIDLFGAYIIGLVTAIGGGTIRDLLLDLTPFWMTDPKYFLSTAAALLAALVFKENLFRWGNTLMLFDTIGLALFTVVGITKSLDAGLTLWVCIVMGTITGTFGGVIRDILLNEVPLLFRKELYALACIAGGGVFVLCRYLSLPDNITKLSAVLTIIIIRLIAVKYQIHLPQFKPINNEDKN